MIHLPRILIKFGRHRNVVLPETGARVTQAIRRRRSSNVDVQPATQTRGGKASWVGTTRMLMHPYSRPSVHIIHDLLHRHICNLRLFAKKLSAAEMMGLLQRLRVRLSQH